MDLVKADFLVLLTFFAWSAILNFLSLLVFQFSSVTIFDVSSCMFFTMLFTIDGSHWRWRLGSNFTLYYALTLYVVNLHIKENKKETKYKMTINDRKNTQNMTNHVIWHNKWELIFKCKSNGNSQHIEQSLR
jgi:Ca2+/Na+ antiporter